MKQFLDLAKERYSVRSYLQKPVEDEKIALILEAAQVAPTARNAQPQKIYVVRSEESLKKLAEVSPCLYGAPVVFVVGYDKRLAVPGKIRPGFEFGETDASIVCTSMMFEAQDLGLGTCWVGWFAEDEVKAALNLPEEIAVCHLLPTGYAAPDALPGKGHSASRNLAEIVQDL